MNNNINFILYILCIITILTIQTIPSFAATTFQLLPNDGGRRIYCDYIEIKERNIICKDNKFVVTYKIDKVKELILIKNTNTTSIKKFTTNNISKINKANSDKIESQQNQHSEEVSKENKQSVFSSLSKIKSYLKTKYNLFFASNTLSIIIQIFGLIIFFTGSIKYVIETFRVSIFWGLSCMFLPFVSFIFLLVHWKVAYKPFLLSLVGLGIMLLGASFSTSASTVTYNAKSHQTKNANYQCSGKIYCSEMTSCAEAKFYLRNCQGTKIDGDYNGIPCEKQWCN